MPTHVSNSSKLAISGIEALRRKLGPFVVAAETTRMAMIFTDGQDAGNAIVFANDAAIALTGFTRTALLGMPLDELLCAIPEATVAFSIAEVLHKGGAGSWELCCRRADGSEFLVAVLIRSVWDEDGVVRQNILSFIDLDEPDKSSLDRDDRFYALCEQTPGFIAATEGPDHRFIFANAAYKRFVGRDITVGSTAAEALPGIVDQGFIDLLDEVYRTGRPYFASNLPISLESMVSGATETRYCDFAYQVIRDANNTITGLFCEGYDVTDQRRAADALSALQAELIHVARVNAMGTMATTLAHELNQPLSAIANYTAGARRLLNSASDTGRLDEALQGIEEASQRAAEIIRNLRELTRRREPAREAFDLRVAVEECVRLVRATAPLSATFEDAVPEALMMSADRVQIQQVTINLLRNACDAVSASDRQQISVSARIDGENLVVSVVDTGPGVSLEAAQNIFSWSDSHKEGGMGLGLSICRTILEAHGGRIWLAHSGNEGSEFCFSIPREPPSASTELGSAKIET